MTVNFPHLMSMLSQIPMQPVCAVMGSDPSQPIPGLWLEARGEVKEREGVGHVRQIQMVRVMKALSLSLLSDDAGQRKEFLGSPVLPERNRGKILANLVLFSIHQLVF